MKDALPFNRSEQYFTATIFPMLVAGDRFRRFGAFTKLLKGFDVSPVAANGANIQLITEFSLKKALVGKAKSRFADAPEDGDTPDIVILIQGEQRRVLIVIEAKMYSVSRRADLKAQMTRQRALIDYLAPRIGVEAADIYHCALLAAAHKAEIGHFSHPILTWEEIASAYSPIVGDDYFLRQLETALERFGELRGAAATDSYGKNADAKLTGTEIALRFAEGSLPYPVMGRNRGLDGPLLADDIASGGWRTQTYEVNTSSEPPNRNWFRVSEFLERLEGSS